MTTLETARTIKPAHRRRSKPAFQGLAHLPVRKKKLFPVIKTAAPTNQSLQAFAAQPGVGKANVVLADCPWSMAGSDTALRTLLPQAHYPTMTPKALLGIDLDLVCAEDCVIGFWALNGQTDLAYRMLAAYGFKVITSVTWLKLREKGGIATIPNGGPSHNVSELFLIARRGRGLPISKTAERFRSVMAVPRTVHSAKPPVFREMLADLYPTTRDGKRVKRLELFGRERVRGWKVWGNQAPDEVGAAPRALKKAA